MTVGSICSHEVDTASPDESIPAVAQRMHARKVGTLVVVDQDHLPIGMVTDRDLAIRVLGDGRDPARTVVRDIMSAHPATVYPDTKIAEALRMMRTIQCRRVPVVDEKGKLVGVLSLDDVLESLIYQVQLVGGLVKDESPRSLAGLF